MSDGYLHSITPQRGTADDPHEIRCMHDVFSDWERRAILYFLLQREDPTAIDRLTRHIVGWRQGEETPVPPDHEAIDRVRHHVVYSHVVKMDNFGVVEYDPRYEEVGLAEDMKVSVRPPWDRSDAPDHEPDQASTGSWHAQDQTP